MRLILVDARTHGCISDLRLTVHEAEFKGLTFSLIRTHVHLLSRQTFFFSETPANHYVK